MFHCFVKLVVGDERIEVVGFDRGDDSVSALVDTCCH